MRLSPLCRVWLGVGLSISVSVAGEKAFDAAAAFGGRPSISVSLSPDGTSIAFIGPLAGSGSALYTMTLGKDTAPRTATVSEGKPFYLRSCEWISNTRLTCQVTGILHGPASELVPMSRVIAVDADGRNQRLLSTQQTRYSRGLQLGGGRVLDVVPEQDGTILMTRVYLPNDYVGSMVGLSHGGVGVDRIDTRAGTAINVEPPNSAAYNYLTDGFGNVRIMATRRHDNSRGQFTAAEFFYRTPTSREWRKLSLYNPQERTGFVPLVVDRDKNIVYGQMKVNGRLAIFSIALDGSLHQELVFARPDVDVDDVIQVGRQGRVAGFGYRLEKPLVHYIDPQIEQVRALVGNALPPLSLITITDASVDESKLLISAESDTNPGTYYLFDRKAGQLRVLLPARQELLGAPLASVQAIDYPARDGTRIPGYLTVPAGIKDPKGLPAIVMPHGGPAARDVWGFNWLAQFFAARGFVVLQPNFRGSAGYGDAWFEQNGFKSWHIAIEDVIDAGQWLVEQGIADRTKLGIVGWSYGGYAALQSAATGPELFKAVIAIAPVTDLDSLVAEHLRWSDYDLVSEYVGSQSREASPINNARRIKAPVLLFHGDLDRNVAILESRRMTERLRSEGGHAELVSWPDLDHQLDDSQARAEMLRKSDAFLRQALGIRPAMAGASGP